MVLRGQRGVEIQKKKKKRKTQKIHLFQVVAPIKLCIVKTAVLAGVHWHYSLRSTITSMVYRKRYNSRNGSR